MVTTQSIKGEIITDSSFGKSQPIVPEGNVYQINDSHGRQWGQNLFHSFESFNIEAGKTANFSGPATVQRIISRVTGGNESQINGTIQSSIAGADIFLLNPKGILFGKSAKLDIDGSFYVSTADYLQMTESKQYVSLSTDISGLVSTPPQSFGFIDSNIASITFTGENDILQEDVKYRLTDLKKDIGNEMSQDSAFSVKGNNHICIIGGEIKIQQGAVIAIEDETSQSSETKGNIQLISTKSKSNIYFQDNELDYSQVSAFDNILIKSSKLNVGGQTTGGITIVGKNIILDNSVCYLNNYGTLNGKRIEIMGDNIKIKNKAKIVSHAYSSGDAVSIKLTAHSDVQFEVYYSGIWTYSGIEDVGLKGQTSSISISAENVYLLDGAEILNRTFGEGHSRDISIDVRERIELSNDNYRFNSSITIDTYRKNATSGDAGTLYLSAKNIELSDGSSILASTRGTGKGGHINIKAEENLHLHGTWIDNDDGPQEGSKIFVRTYGNTKDSGDSGSVSIKAKNILLEDGASIYAQTYSSGKGGNLSLIADENITLQGKDGKNNPSVINTSCVNQRNSNGSANAGYLEMEANNIYIRDGAWINTQTEAKGNAGNIKITAHNKLEISGEGPEKKWIGKTRLASAVVSGSTNKSTGHGGQIDIHANEILLSGGAFIQTGTQSSGNAGEINIIANTITLMGSSSKNRSSQIESNSYAKDLVYDVNITGTGGKITINAKNINLFDGAQISSSSMAEEKASGKAGDIDIRLEDTLRISGQNLEAEEIVGRSSGIYARSRQNIQAVAGEAGKIKIYAGSIVMDNHALVSTSSNGLENAGDIEIQTRQSILLTASRIASESLMAFDNNQNGGEAGIISINAGDDVQLFQSARITTNAISSGGGRINIHTQKALTLINSDITTNVFKGEGNGGDINIRSELTIMNHGIISANADAGDGGAIFIHTRNLIQSTDSRIEATSKRGNDGTVEIETPDIEENENILNLSGNFLHTMDVVKTLCDMEKGKDAIQLVVNKPYAIPSLSSGWYHLSANESIRLAISNISDQFDHIANDFSDDALYQSENRMP